MNRLLFLLSNEPFLLFKSFQSLRIKDFTMEYSVQIVQERTYQPSEAMKALNNAIDKFKKLASMLVQEYIKELIDLERSSEGKVIFPSFGIEDIHYNEKNLDLVIEKYIKPVYWKSQLCDRSILFFVLQETPKLFPNLFKMYCDENKTRDLLVSQCNMNNARDYHYHSGDRGRYEDWVVEKCLGLNQ